MMYASVIEQFCLGKSAEQVCEDAVVVTPYFAAVIDGSTSKKKTCPGEESPGHFAMRRVGEAIHLLPPDADKITMLHSLNHVLNVGSDYRPTCSAAIFSYHRRVVWLVGDCQCRFSGITHKHEKLVDKVLSQIRSDILHYRLQQGLSTKEDLFQEDVGRAFILPFLRDQLYFQNAPCLSNPFRYPVFDGQPIEPDDVPEYDVMSEKEIVLATDGYPLLADTLAETEEHLHRILQCDPLCMDENCSTKGRMTGCRSFDDRAYLRLQIRK